MTDIAKRRTLKGMAAVAAGTATAGLTSNAFAGTEVNGMDIPTEGHLAIDTRISPRGNDVEAVFTNAGSDTLHIDQLAPHNIDTYRGNFNVASLTADQPLVLEPGASVTVSMTPHKDRLKFNELMRQGQSLSQALERTAAATNTHGTPIHISVNQTRAYG